MNREKKLNSFGKCVLSGDVDDGEAEFRHAAKVFIHLVDRMNGNIYEQLVAIIKAHEKAGMQVTDKVREYQSGVPMLDIINSAGMAAKDLK